MLSWLAGYVMFASPFQWVGPLFDGTLPAWGDVVFDFSQIVPGLVIFCDRSQVSGVHGTALSQAVPVRPSPSSRTANSARSFSPASNITSARSHNQSGTSATESGSGTTHPISMGP
jgi:hypothetical protein